MNNRLTHVATIRTAVAEVMDVSGYGFDPAGLLTLKGRLIGNAYEAEQRLKAKLAAVGFIPTVNHLPDASVHVLVTAGFAPSNQGLQGVQGIPELMTGVTRTPSAAGSLIGNRWLPVILFVATVLSVFLTGAANEKADPGDPAFSLLNGFTFSFSLMSILVAHEFGHWLIGRLRGEQPSLPFFIPLPFISMFGTLGAVIVQRQPFKNKRTLLEVALAGPLFGFIVAVPLFVIGLMISKVVPTVPADSAMLGNSLLTTVLLLFKSVPAGQALYTHPILDGAWIGLLITGMNLVPAGQLDGGHISYALLGERGSRILTLVMVGAMAALALTVSPAYFVWAVLLFVFGRAHPPVADPTVKLQPWHFALALVGLMILILVFVPQPISAALAPTG